MTTLAQAVDLPDALFRRYTAIREIGHALTAVATGQARVIECALEPGTASDGTRFDAFTEVRWQTLHAYLTLLQAGAMAQERWLREQGLWTPRRDLATQVAARQSRAAVQATAASADEIERAAAWAQELLGYHWPLLLHFADLLDQRGHLYGSHLRKVLRVGAHATGQPL
ncbi:hypothetical protein [Streptomyces sp. S1D4-20]|uniref:hypothetical protein n=1 Tax=Streptomyces sp. S1D4-20 TaxID=2594462 RepID=UPI0011643E4E|nr:hypothetical protein [Streptomyces sp. S1D4-20]QDN54199.1 hypothetical protein FNV67_01110 [Streptomyces sp. S1D4-20]